MIRIAKSILAILLFWGGCQNSRAAAYINPLEYGIRESKSAIDNYNILLKCHQDAIRLNKDICYKGIDSIELEIPIGAKGIPLAQNTDFGNTKVSKNQYDYISGQYAKNCDRSILVDE